MKACKVLFFLLMPFCNMAQSGTLSDPYTALGQAWHVPASGTYYFSIGATTFSTYVESGSGWILAASGSGATDESAYPVTTTLSLQSDEILPAAVYTSALVTAVRMNASAGPDLPLDVQSTDAVVLSNLQNDRTLSDNSNSTAWSGTGTTFLSRSCNSVVGSLSSRIYHACGNFNGFHWIVFDGATYERVKLSGTGKNDLNLWIRADLVALPVTLINFRADLLNDHTVEINWQTASETASRSFVVERSTDADHWEEVSTVAAAGVATTPQHYRALDETPYSKLSYYRLKEIDVDGKFSYSKVIPVRVNTGTALAVYPNPVTNGKLVLAMSKRSAIKIFNSTGQLVRTLHSAAGRRELDVSALPNGLYIVQVNDKRTTILIQ
jgi:hypothetical protein